MAAEPKWSRVTDVRAFIESRGRRCVGEHQWAPLKRIPWPYCKRCGLLALRNDVTRAAMKAACEVEE